MYTGLSNFQHMVVKRATIKIDCDGKTGRVRITVVAPDMSRIVVEVVDVVELQLS